MLQDHSYMLPELLFHVAEFGCPGLIKDRYIVSLVDFSEDREGVLSLFPYVFDVTLIRELYFVEVKNVTEFSLVRHQLHDQAESIKCRLLVRYLAG